MMPRSLFLPIAAALLATQPLRADYKLTLIGQGVAGATYVTTPPGETDRIFVTSDGQGVALMKNGVVQPQLFLDMTPILALSRGLVSMAFHPDYANNGRFFVAYADENLFNHVVEYHVSATDPDLADPNSAIEVLTPVQMQAADHTIDHLAFGPDGMLYVSIGDGIPVSDMGPNPAQDESSLLGKLLRLDVDQPFPHIPADNPFVGVPGARGEIYSMGLRQPWRFSFDAETDRIWISDVGYVSREELNVLPRVAAAGTNFGWRCNEGTQCNMHPSCNPLCNGWTEPGWEYPHTQGLCAIIGGTVYRGNALPELAGKYLFSDWCSSRFFMANLNLQGMVSVQEITNDLVTSDGGTLFTVPAMGVNGDGEVLVLMRAGGKVYRLDPGCETTPLCDTTPNSAGPGAMLTASGSNSVAFNGLTFEVTGMPAFQPGLLFYSGGMTNMPFGGGVLCAGGAGNTIFRIGPPVTSDGAGELTRPVDLTAGSTGAGPGEVLPGSKWHFQLWYRDQAAGNFDLSSAVTVQFCP